MHPVGPLVQILFITGNLSIKVDFSKLNIRKADLGGVVLGGVVLQEADLQEADLRGAKNMENSKLTNTNLKDVRNLPIPSKKAEEMGALNVPKN